MSFELRQDKEALPSEEVIPERRLSRMVKVLCFELDLDERGPILKCSYKDLELGLIKL